MEANAANSDESSALPNTNLRRSDTVNGVSKLENILDSFAVQMLVPGVPTYTALTAPANVDYPWLDATWKVAGVTFDVAKFVAYYALYTNLS